MMNIYAKQGDKIIVTESSYENGHEPDDRLTIGKIYTVEYTEVDRSYTDVYIKEIPGSFNSVNFEDYKHIDN